MKNRFFKVIASLLCVTLFLACFSCNKKEQGDERRYTIVDGAYLYEDGISEYSILLRDDANYYESFAADELNRILKLATGNSLSVVTDSTINETEHVISLGHTSLWDKKVNLTLSNEDIVVSGYYVKTVEKNIYISCPDNTNSCGVLYGVYDLLKDLVDYEFYAATEIQYNVTKEIPLHNYKGFIVNPTFEMRILTNFDLRSDSDTARRYRMINPTESFGMATYGHGQLSQYLKPDSPCTCGADGCEGKTYYEHHPEWFSNYNTKEQQLCWTAGGDATSYELLVKTTANRFADFFTQLPEADNFMFGQEDSLSYCTCKGCQKALIDYAGQASGLQVAFMNDVIKVANDWLKDNFPGRRVKYIIYAYYGLEAAPVVTDANGNVKPYSSKVVPVDDLYIFFAPIYTHFSFQLNSDKNKSVYKNLQDWGSIADGQIIIYLYDINFRHYLINFNNFGTVKAMYEECKDLGVAAMTSQAADSYTACFREMRSYVESSLMWNLDQSYDDLVRKFMKAYYKDAADYIYAYYQILRDRYAYYQNIVDTNSGGIYGDIDKEGLWTQPVIEKIDAEFDKALAVIEQYKTTNPDMYETLKNRIMKERLSPMYIKLAILSSAYSEQEIAEIKAEFKYYVNLFKLSEVSEGTEFGGFLD